MPPVDASSRAAFEALFEQHHRAILAYCLRRSRSATDAEDLAAETFTVAWRRFADVPADARPWLYAVARRILANHHRGTGRWERLLDRLRGQPPTLEAAPPGGGLALDALADLSDDDQELLKLVAWEELSHAEIAATLSITPNAVAIRLHRARQRYARAYEAMGGTTVKGSDPSRTSLPATGSSTGRWRHEDA